VFIMKDVVERVLGAEREARERMERAKADAAAVRANADRAAEATVHEARERAAALIRERLEAARSEAAALLEAGKTAARAEAEAWYAKREPELDRLAARVLDAVANPDPGAR